VVGGVIVGTLSFLYLSVRYRLRSFNLQRLLGFRFKPGTNIRLTYGQLQLPPVLDSSGKPKTHPYVKPPRRGQPPLNLNFSIERPVSECEVRASAYIATLLGSPGVLRPVLVSDVDVSGLLDSTFVSFGGPSNYKTVDILSSPANVFIQFTGTSFALFSGEPLPYACTSEVDFGAIIRIRPPEFPQRAWIVCAGLGEWGTSGSAWYLAHRWQVLLRKIQPLAYWLGSPSISDFLAIVRVVPGQDQSARLECLYRGSSGRAIRVEPPSNV
jgi:hypothetical protein